MTFWKIVSLVFPPFFGHDIRVNIKNFFLHFFPKIFLQQFLPHYSCVSAQIVSCVFFPPIFWSRYPCEYKKTFLPIIPTFFFRTFFARTIRVFLENLCRTFFPTFLGHDIRVNIKNVISHFFQTICFLNFLLALFVCFWKHCFARFFPRIFL